VPTGEYQKERLFGGLVATVSACGQTGRPHPDAAVNKLRTTLKKKARTPFEGVRAIHG